MLKSGGKKLEEWLTRICKIVWKNEKNIGRLEEKSNHQNAQKRIPSALTTGASRYLLNQFKGANQAGFRPERSCIYQIFGL